MADEKIVLGNNSEKNQNTGAVGNNEPVNTPIEEKVEKTSQDIAKEHNIPEQYLDMEFQVPTEEIKLPSRGVFYKNKKDSVTIKYLTAEEDDILYSPDLIKSGKVLDVLLDKAVKDTDLRPENMLSGDRNYLLVEIRKTGLGNDYVPGEITCPSCGQVHEPTIDLSKLGAKPLEVEPDADGEYEIELPLMKMRIRFRLLTGVDEKRLSKLAEVKGKKSGGIKVAKLVTEKYVMQIMEVNGNRDKLYIKKFIAAMPMKDSMFFREYIKRIEPGLDLSYEFECPSCGELDIKDIPITPKLFYPDLEQ
jgi:predicted RNA-binding Zn-ribbon protein involved in translation (DUF1610 family)